MSNSCECSKVYTVGDWLFGCVNFAIPADAVKAVCAGRCISIEESYASAKSGDVDIRLLKADMFRWIVLGASKVNGTKDSDNGWSHSDGGYALSEFDKKLLMDEANAIYSELEPDSVFGKTKIRMRSAGIMPAYRNTDGEPLPRNVI